MRKKKKIGSYPNTMIIISLTAALFLIGFCGMLVIQSKKMVSIIRQNIEVRAFLEKDITETGRDSILQIIRQKSFIQKSEGTPLITFVSKDEAAKDYIEDSKEDFRTILEDNPFLDSYRIKIEEDFFEESKLKAIKAELEQIPNVHEVVYQENLADDINKNITKIYIILASFALIMLIIIVLLINNTIKLAIYSQRFLIRSMQLVGATNGFIQKPFLVRGASQGLIAGLFACVLLAVVQQLATRNIEGFALLQEYDKLGILFLLMIVLGMMIGITSTFQSLSRYLRMTLDDLY